MCEFISQNNLVRPKRLSEKTRFFAFESLNKKYGLDTLQNMAVSLDKFENFESLSFIEKYDLAIKKIAEHAPIRICENEKLSGSATLGLAINHLVPATYNGYSVCVSISHLTVNFEEVLKIGVNGIKQKIKRSLEKYKNTEKQAFLTSCLNCVNAFEIWHARYLKALENKLQYKEIYENLKIVPFNPATNFYQAVQSIWFTFAFIRLCGNWPGIGRIDYLLGEFLKKDLQKGVLTLDEAREIIAHFFIKGCEWVNGQYVGSGDAQHYQNIVLSGIDENANDVTNEVTYLVLDVLEELGISDFPTSVRLNKNSDQKLLNRVASVMRFGGGILAVYNEDAVIRALLRDGYAEKEARNFANDGCWEVQIPGKTYFNYGAFDSLHLLQTVTLKSYEENSCFNSFEDLYAQYIKDLNERILQLYKDYSVRFDFEKDASGLTWKEAHPCTVVSIFEQGCIEKGLSYIEGGPVYNILSPHIGGVTDTVNSLYAIKKLVFDEKRVNFSTLMKILKNNWEGEEFLRRIALTRYDYYGNDNDEVDSIATSLISDFCDICDSLNGRCGYKFPAGISTFGRQIEWSPYRLACAHGRKKGEILAGNCSPTPSSDKQGVTAVIRSYCKINHLKVANGSALDVKLLPSNVAGENGLNALVSLLRAFVSLGGFFMQPDVIDAEILKKAQQNPEDYQTLSVRVSGWNARFVTLDKHWQKMVIEQNERKY